MKKKCFCFYHRNKSIWLKKRNNMCALQKLAFFSTNVNRNSHFKLHLAHKREKQLWLGMEGETQRERINHFFPNISAYPQNNRIE